MDTGVESVGPEVHLSKVSRLMAAYNTLAIPVVDADKRLLGAISIDDVLDHLLPDDWREMDDEVHEESDGASDG